MYIRSYIGERIRQRRKQIGLTQTELAKRLNPGIDNVMHTQVAKWEKQGTLEVDSLIRLCNALDCDIDYLLGAIDTPRRATYDVVQKTGISCKAADVLRSINKGMSYGGKYYGPVGVNKNGTVQETLTVLSELIESPRFLPLMNELSYYLIDGGAFPAEAEKAPEPSPQEYDRFMRWANASGLGVEKKADICEMHLQKAADELKNMFRDVLEREIKDKP